MDPHAQIAASVAPGATVLRRRPLHGGVSAHVEALELVLPTGEHRQVVLRRHGAAKWKALDESVTTTEFHLLEALAAAGMEVPKPLYLDATSELLGSPFFVMEFVHGDTAVDAATLPGALPRMAAFLRRLHALRVELPGLRTCEDPVASALSFISPDDPVYPVLRELGTLPPKNAPALTHGDYWPGNVLWRDGEIAAVLDWEDATLGDPLADLAGCRLELLWRYGEDAAENFSRHYLAGATIDCTNLPYWELYAASAAAAFMSEWGLEPAREREMRQKAERVIAAARSAIV